MSYGLSVYKETQLSLKQSIIMNKFNFSHSSPETPALPAPLIIRVSNDPLKQKGVTAWHVMIYRIMTQRRLYVIVIQCCTFSGAYALRSDEISFFTLSGKNTFVKLEKTSIIYRLNAGLILMKYKDEHILIKIIYSKSDTLLACFVSQNCPCWISIKNTLYVFMCVFYIFISRGKVKFYNKLREIKYK